MSARQQMTGWMDGGGGSEKGVKKKVMDPCYKVHPGDMERASGKDDAGKQMAARHM